MANIDLHVLDIYGSCTSGLWINTTGSPIDCHKSKKVWQRGVTWHPSGPRISGDTLDAGQANAHRLLRPPPRVASYHPAWLIPLLAGATEARERAAVRTSSRHGPPIPPLWPVYMAATAWPSRWRVRAAARVGISSCGASRNCRSSGTRTTVGAEIPSSAPAARGTVRVGAVMGSGVALTAAASPHDAAQWWGSRMHRSRSAALS